MSLSLFLPILHVNDVEKEHMVLIGVGVMVGDIPNRNSWMISNYAVIIEMETLKTIDSQI
jgi:hypothetical protein